MDVITEILWVKFRDRYLLQDLDTISLINMYEPLIHAAIQYKEFPPYLYYQTHIVSW